MKNLSLTMLLVFIVSAMPVSSSAAADTGPAYWCAGEPADFPWYVSHSTDLDGGCGILVLCDAEWTPFLAGWQIDAQCSINSPAIDEHVHAKGYLSNNWYFDANCNGERNFTGTTAWFTMTGHASWAGSLTQMLGISGRASVELYIELWDITSDKLVAAAELHSNECNEIYGGLCGMWYDDDKEFVMDGFLTDGHLYDLRLNLDLEAYLLTGTTCVSSFWAEADQMVMDIADVAPADMISWGAVKGMYR